MRADFDKVASNTFIKKTQTKVNLKSLINKILNEHAGKRTDGKVASHSTTTTLGNIIRTCFNDLRRLGFKLENAKNLSEKHVEALSKYWMKREIAISTIQGRMSALRIFSGWIGKENMVKSLPEYLPEVPRKELIVKKVAIDSKSWTENGVDVIKKIQEADQNDKIFGLMLRVELAFGLRRKEVLHVQPWKSDKGDRLAIYESKNGRPRDVYIVTNEQRELLDMIKGHYKKTDYMGWKMTKRGQLASMEYNLNRYNKEMAAIGITKEEAGTTGHGLRAQFAENLALIMQMIPPTLGGTGGQMSKEDLFVKRAQVSEELGHSRASITSAYYGSYGRNVTQDEADRSKKHIDAGLKAMTMTTLSLVNPDRIEDCLTLIKELAAINVDATMEEVNYLWEVHSRRHGRPWIKPLQGNVISIEVAAIKIANLQKPC